MDGRQKCAGSGHGSAQNLHIFSYLGLGGKVGTPFALNSGEGYALTVEVSVIGVRVLVVRIGSV